MKAGTVLFSGASRKSKTLIYYLEISEFQPYGKNRFCFIQLMQWFAAEAKKLMCQILLGSPFHVRCICLPGSDC